MTERTRQRKAQVTIIGPYDADAVACDLAEKAGYAIGKLGCTIISGGRGGVMEAASKGAHAAGALCIGILPGESLDEGNDYLQVVIPSGIRYARNLTNVLAADVVVAIGGGSGTLNEMAYAWMHGKTIVALVGAGGWADKLAGQRIDDRRKDVVIKAESVDELRQIVADRIGLCEC
jgi:hypothetical protein